MLKKLCRDASKGKGTALSQSHNRLALPSGVKVVQAQRIPLSMNKPLPQNIAWREDAGNSTPSKGPLKRSRESEKTVQWNPF